MTRLATLSAEVDPGAGLATCLNLEVSEGTPYATTYQYNSVGYLTEVTDAEGNRTVYSDHDGVGNVGKITDARGFETAFSYDGLDHVTSITRDIGPLGDQQAVENFQYDALGNLRRSTDARGEEYESRYEYDSHYRLTAFEQELVFNGDDALRSTFGYDQVGNLISSTDPRGEFYTTTFVVDAGGRVVQEIVPTGTESDPGTPAVFTREYDEAGNLIAEGDSRGEGYTQRYRYDKVGRMDQIIRPTGSNGNRGPDAVTEFDFDAAGNVIKILHPRSNADGERFEQTYDYNGRGTLNFQIDAVGNRTDYGYDDAGNISTLTQAGGEFADTRVTTFEYDQLNRIRFERLGGRETEHRYDETGNPTYLAGPFTDIDGQLLTTTMSYDAQGFLIATTDPADYVHRIERDEVGNIIARIDPRGDYYRTVIEYDGANRPRTQSEPTGTESDPGNA